MKPLISVVVPAFNEEDCISELVRRLSLVMDTETRYDFEVILIDNGSEDETLRLMMDAESRDPRFRTLRLSRNFRFDGGLTAGLSEVRGDACVLMAADLQDPPESIPDFLRKWEDGWENIYGVVTARAGVSTIRRLNSRLFYWVADLLTSGAFPRNVSDFRLVDRTVYEAVRSMTERNRFVRGLFGWVGFRSTGIPIPRPRRFGGSSKAYTLKVLDLAFRGIFAHTTLPLRLITVFGLVTSATSFVALILLSVVWVLKGVPFAGFGTLVSLALLVVGSLAFMIGLVSEYVGLVYEEVKQRPNFVVAKPVPLVQEVSQKIEKWPDHVN